ncbi:MAG: HD domain-containing phosphohydrolase [Phascolarctobacterium sp.]
MNEDVLKKKILIVDDQEINRDMLEGILFKEYELVLATNGLEALEALGKNGNGFDLMLLDLKMPDMDGFEVLQHINDNGIIEVVPVIVISAEDDHETENICLHLKVTDFIRKPFDNLTVKRRVENVIKLYTIQHDLEKQVYEKTKEIQAQNAKLAEQASCLKRTNERIIELLGTVVEYRNLESGKHIQRVKGFTRILAEQLAGNYPEYGLTQKQINIIVAASALHDVGKIAISDSILLKPGRLTKEEFEVMKTHTTEGSAIIEHIKGIGTNEYEKVSYEIARYHHERFDGRGYPDGLVGDEIPISAQIVAIADVYDALVSKRCYKDAYGKGQAFKMIMAGECGVFSEKILTCFTKAKEAFEALADEYAE